MTPSTNGTSAVAIDKSPPPSRLKPLSILDLTPEQYQRIDELATQVKNSGLSYKKLTTKDDKGDYNELSVNDIKAIIFKGLELGMMPMASLESLDWILGKPTLDPAGMIALCYASGQLMNIEFLEETATRCHIRMTRWGMEPYEKVVTIEDYAKMLTTVWVNNKRTQAPLTTKDNWKQQPATMLKCRLISAMCRYYLGDVIQGLYTAEELGADVTVDDSMAMTVVEGGLVSPSPQQPAAIQESANPPKLDSQAQKPNVADQPSVVKPAAPTPTVGEADEEKQPITSIDENVNENQVVGSKLGQNSHTEGNLPPAGAPLGTEKDNPSPTKEAESAASNAEIAAGRIRFLKEAGEFVAHKDEKELSLRITKTCVLLGFPDITYHPARHDLMMAGLRNYFAQHEFGPDGEIIEKMADADDIPFVSQEAEDDISSFEFEESM